MQTDLKQRTYTVDEAAAILGIGRNHCYDAAKRGDLPCVKLGKRVLVLKAALDRMLDGAGGK